MQDVIFHPNGTTNVPKLVVEHRAVSRAWREYDAQAADLALNIVEWFLRGIKYGGDKRNCSKGQCFTLAYDLHQKFKEIFLTTIPKEGGTIPHDAIVEWVTEQIIIRMCPPIDEPQS